MHMRRSSEAEATISQSRELSVYETLPDDVFNHIGRLSVPKFAFILCSKHLYSRSRCDTRNGFLFDMTTLFHMDMLRKYDHPRINNFLASFHTSRDEIFLHLYRTLKHCHRDGYFPGWDEMIQPVHLTRLFNCPGIRLKDYIHPLKEQLHFVWKDDVNILRQLFVDLLSSECLTDEECAERISPLYRRMKFIEFDHKHRVIFHHTTSSDYRYSVGTSLLQAYLDSPRNERTDARMRTIIHRIFFPSSFDCLATTGHVFISMQIALLAISLFGQYAWKHMLRPGRLPLSIDDWFYQFHREVDLIEEAVPINLARKLFGNNLPQILENWAHNLFDIVVTSEDPHRFLSIDEKPENDGSDDEASDYNTSDYKTILDLATSLIHMRAGLVAYTMKLPWVELFKWFRRHSHAWSRLLSWTQMHFLDLAAREHFLSGFFDLDLNFRAHEVLSQWILDQKVSLDGTPTPEYHENLILFVSAKSSSHELRKMANFAGFPPEEYYTKLCDIIREREKDYAHLLQ